MNLITVIPLTRSKVSDTLSYFTAADIPVGAIVTVPLRSKSIFGIVTETRPAEDLKAEIKKAPFEIRKLTKVKATRFFPAKFVDTCKVLAEYYATKPGAIMDALVSDALLNNASKIAPPLPPQSDLWAEAKTGIRSGSGIGAGAGIHPLKGAEETFAVQADDADRMSTWRSLIRQEFARKKSIAIYAPTIEDAKNIFASLERGIEGFIFMLHSGITPKKMIETWTKISNIAHPVVIIATGSFSLLPRGDVGTVIIERENARGWIAQKAPYLDLRHAIETLARALRQTVYLSDSLLRAETLRRVESLDIAEGTPFKWRSVSLARDSVIDMRAFKSSENNFKVISPELEDLIRENRDESTHLFILAVRRGISTVTVCDDCETIVGCENCSAPVVLHVSKASGKHFFLCHKCGERRGADIGCANCGGWRLTPLGVGIDRVAEEIRAKIPDADIYQLDADSTPTEKQISDTISSWRAKPGSILLGTEMAVTHLGDKVDHVAVASLDSLFSLPDFRIEEKIVYTLIRLRNLALKSIMVQTRRPDEKAFEYGLKGNLSDWNRSNMSDRKQFTYPPFAVLVKITLEGKKEAIAKEMAETQKLVEPHAIDVFPAFTATLRGNSVIHGLIKIEPHAWPDRELISVLRTLPPGVSVKINPESLL